MKISLGPILYCWNKNDVYDFYEAVKDAEVDSVYLGEAVCSRRRELQFHDWLELARTLAATGKEVILTSLALVESPSKLNEVRRAVDNGEFIIEANDFSAVNLCHDRRLPFVAGHALNLYNAEALAILLRQGMMRWCMPVELSQEWFMGIVEQAKMLDIWNKFETEIFSYGYLPLAYSARCFTARALKKVKADCETCCIEDPNGRAIYSQDNLKIFTMNGIQTQSGACYNLINELQNMTGFINYIRLSPLGTETLDMLKAFRKKMIDPEQQYPLTQSMCHGYWLGLPGKD